MASSDLRARGIAVVIATATVVALAAYGTRSAASTSDHAPSSRAVRGIRDRGDSAAFVAAVSRRIGSAAHGLAVFSSSDGRRLRWLVRSAPAPVPVGVSPDGRSLYYYYDEGLLRRGRCPSGGFVDPVLWKVPTGGGRPGRAGIRTPSIAFSPDGRMVAYTASSECGRVVRIVVRNRRTGVTRRIMLAHNSLQGQPVFSAQLSWAPDDMHLAVAVAPAAGINGLSVINALRARNAIAAPSVFSCGGNETGCLDPMFDASGRLTFLKWGEEANSFAVWVMRWHHAHVKRLFRLSREQTYPFIPSIAVNRTGRAVLLDGGPRYPNVWRWYRGNLRLILRSTPSRVVLSPLWIPGRG